MCSAGAGAGAGARIRGLERDAGARAAISSVGCCFPTIFPRQRQRLPTCSCSGRDSVPCNFLGTLVPHDAPAECRISTICRDIWNSCACKTITMVCADWAPGRLHRSGDLHSTSMSVPCHHTWLLRQTRAQRNCRSVERTANTVLTPFLVANGNSAPTASAGRH